MVPRLDVLLGASYGIHAVNALVAPQPRATESVGFGADGMTPAPTSAPQIQELFKRKHDDLVVATVFDQTCGYISGEPGAALTCYEGTNCMMAPALEALICVGGGVWDARLYCLDSTDALDPATCNEACKANTFTWKCTFSAAPFCRTFSYNNGVMDYDCASTRPAGIIRASVTYSGEDLDDRDAFTTTINLGDESSSSGSIITNTRDSPLISSASSSGVGTLTSPPTATPTGRGDDGESLNAGAIAGGVVGGIVALGLIGLAAIFILRKKKKPPVQEQPQIAQQPQHPQQPPPVYSPPQQMVQPQFMGNMPPPVAPQGDGKMGFASPHTSMVTTASSMGSVSPAYTNNSAYPFNNQPQPPAQTMSPPPQMPSPQQSLIQPQHQPQQGYTPPPPQQQQPVIHEIGTDNGGHHRGNLHEMS